jgi:hypothetical protein
LAACTDPPAFRSRNLFCNGFDLSKGAPLSWRETVAGFAARFVDRGRQFGWQLEAWAVFSNHHHFIAHSPADAADASSLSDMLAQSAPCPAKPR